ADRFDVSALFAAEQVAGTADLQVERRDTEAAAEIAELLDRRQPFFRDRRQIVFRRNKQVGIRRTIRAADTPAQLVQLRQTIAIGTVDQNRIGVGNIQA